MKPFDLEAALNGARVVTRDGKEVTQLTRFYDTYYDECLRGLINAELQDWNEQGKHLSDENESPLDLFMAPNTKSIWVARFGDGIRIGAHPTKWECEEAHPDADDYHEITYEE